MGSEYAKKRPGIQSSAGSGGGYSAPERSFPNSARLDALKSGAMKPSAAEKGQQFDLKAAMRERMEKTFGADFSKVKTYESQTVADAGAEAVAQGNEIAFAPGKTDFSSQSGQALLGHELSHVASQSRGEVTGSGLLSDSGLEARADREGSLAARGETVNGGDSALNGGAVMPLSSVSAAPMQGPMQAKKPSKSKKPKAAQPRNPRMDRQAPADMLNDFVILDHDGEEQPIPGAEPTLNTKPAFFGGAPQLGRAPAPRKRKANAKPVPRAKQAPVKGPAAPPPVQVQQPAAQAAQPPVQAAQPAAQAAQPPARVQRSPEQVQQLLAQAAQAAQSLGQVQQPSEQAEQARDAVRPRPVNAAPDDLKAALWGGGDNGNANMLARLNPGFEEPQNDAVSDEGLRVKSKEEIAKKHRNLIRARVDRLFKVRSGLTYSEKYVSDMDKNWYDMTLASDDKDLVGEIASRYHNSRSQMVAERDRAEEANAKSANPKSRMEMDFDAAWGDSAFEMGVYKSMIEKLRGTGTSLQRHNRPISKALAKLEKKDGNQEIAKRAEKMYSDARTSGNKRDFGEYERAEDDRKMEEMLRVQEAEYQKEYGKPMPEEYRKKVIQLNQNTLRSQKEYIRQDDDFEDIGPSREAKKNIAEYQRNKKRESEFISSYDDSRYERQNAFSERGQKLYLGRTIADIQRAQYAKKLEEMRKRRPIPINEDEYEDELPSVRLN